MDELEQEAMKSLQSRDYQNIKQVIKWQQKHWDRTTLKISLMQIEIQIHGHLPQHGLKSRTL